MSKALDAWLDLESRLQSIAAFGQAKAVKLKDPDGLLSQMSGVPGPFCGVVYEGMRSQRADKQGLSTVAVFGLYLAVEVIGAVRGLETETSTLDLLDTMRDTVLGDRATGGHKWAFVVEAFSGIVKGKALWVQRWETPLILQRPAG